MTGPSPQALLAETARLAHHFHWSLDAILDLEHRDRHQFLALASSEGRAVALTPRGRDRETSDVHCSGLL